MPAPRDLTARFMEAYNRRDHDALRALLAPELEYVRPGGGVLRTADEVMGQYECDWSVLAASRVEVRELTELEDGVIAEITVHVTTADGSGSVEAALVHRWRDGLLVRYRLYADPLPSRVAAVQPPP
jgi:ketosteroid isomerase-like protein